MSAIDLKINEVGIIKELVMKNKIQRQRLMDLGFISNQKIELYRKSYGIYGFKILDSVFALRKEDAQQIILK
jgi:Fe2+ transport system protein FeoA